MNVYIQYLDMGPWMNHLHYGMTTNWHLVDISYPDLNQNLITVLSHLDPKWLFNLHSVGTVFVIISALYCTRISLFLWLYPCHIRITSCIVLLAQQPLVLHYGHLLFCFLKHEVDYNLAKTELTCLTSVSNISHNTLTGEVVVVSNTSAIVETGIGHTCIYIW